MNSSVAIWNPLSDSFTTSDAINPNPCDHLLLTGTPRSRPIGEGTRNEGDEGDRRSGLLRESALTDFEPEVILRRP